MAALRTDLLAFFRSVFRHWRAGVTGGVIAVAVLIATTYYRVPKAVITAALVGYVVVAAFYAWREEHKLAEERQDARHRAVIACFQRCVDIMATDNVMPFTALLRADAHLLETSDEVTGVCIFMETYNHGDPFTHIDQVISFDQRLAFLKFVRWSPNFDRNNEVFYLDAAQEWAERFNVPVSKETRLKLIMRKYLPFG